jgi:trehalose 6-phosphate phosphatase
MQSLFTPEGQARLGQLIRPGVLCVFDFDGTLAPITAEPDGARMSQDILKRMIRLSSYTPIAVLTGRSVADISERLGFKPHYLVGNHGLEGIPGREADQAQHEECCRAWRMALDQHFTGEEYADAGIFIEDKRYSLSVHYRLANDHADASRKLVGLFLQLDPPPRVVSGKCVFNLLPQGAADKGIAMEQLLQISGAASAIYIGDDVTDEDVFRLQRPDVLSIRVEHSAESAADFFIPAHDDIARLLDDLLSRLQQQGNNAG